MSLPSYLVICGGWESCLLEMDDNPLNCSALTSSLGKHPLGQDWLVPHVVGAALASPVHSLTRTRFLMSTAVETPPVVHLPVHQDLTSAVVKSVDNALTMCEMTARCVSLSAVPRQDQGLVTGMIGVHGKVSGFVTVNISERLAVKSVGGLLQEKFAELTSQVVDGVGEITNIIVGGIKGNLAGTPWGFSNITVPSVIVGKGYQIAYARGLEFISATFEHDDPDILMMDDRMLHVSMSLLKL